MTPLLRGWQAGAPATHRTLGFHRPVACPSTPCSNHAGSSRGEVQAIARRSVAAAAYQRRRPPFGGFVQQQDARQPLAFDPEDTAAWMLLDLDRDGGGMYDDFGEEEVEVVEDKEPKYVNGKRVRVNSEIEAPRLRVQGIDRDELGVMSTEEARSLAASEGVDLVLISPDADPPVSRLVSFSKYKYEAEKAAKQRQKASKTTDTKEVRMRPVTEEHDYQVKLKQAAGFLKKGSKVKLSMSFSGRELRFKDQGKELMLRFVEDLSGSSKPDGPLNFKTSTFSVTLAPIKP